MTTAPAVRAHVLVVNDQIITVQDILEPIWELLEREAGELSPSQYRYRLERRVRDEIRNQVYQALVYRAAEAMLDQQQTAQLDRAVDQAVQERINRVYGGRQSSFEWYLQRFGKTVEDVRERQRRALMLQYYLRQKILPRVHVTRRELLAYWRQHRDEFEIRPQTEMFLIDVPGWAFLEQVGPDTGARLARRLWRRADAATRAEALTKARAQVQRALLEIEGGADFAAVARRYSRGINASKGGYWGFISELGLTGRWAAAGRALSELQPGQISSIIETPEGFFLVKAGRRRPGKRISFEQAQPQIERRLVAEQTDRLSAELLGRLRAEATLSDELEQRAFFEAVLAAAPKPAGSSPGR